MAEVTKSLHNEIEIFRKEVDRLDQYGRRHLAVIQNVELPAVKEKPEEIEEKVNNIISKDLKCATEAKDIDKTHRIGKIRSLNNEKKAQNIIVCFRASQSRYNDFLRRIN